MKNSKEKFPNEKMKQLYDTIEINHHVGISFIKTIKNYHL